MRVIICDKCGKEMEKEELRELIISRKGAVGEPTVKDLCGWCAEKVMSFIEGDREA